MGYTKCTAVAVPYHTSLLKSCGKALTRCTNDAFFDQQLAAMFADKVLTLPRKFMVAELPEVLKVSLVVANPDWVTIPGRGRQVSLGTHGLVGPAMGPTWLGTEIALTTEVRL